ncbi:exopolysaccharide biosynthesis polyprenyl glycosylphosphotransferase [Acidicapsa dinghuensis]|uniref:Exopolysaccharide biosynthesis polyprenyl glycosylphosphotransferase n=1 Tax=Acidicapsa dinghuensis TaxID=2218256 RepID=A0ABW1EE63_9BACT|nr:exopolysaccharide biosynthesis polyprenyl glycosylphosphotransferase [Acidicapsa dinghuensis]
MSTSDSVAPHLYAEPFETSRAERQADPDKLLDGFLCACEIAADLLVCISGMVSAFWLQHYFHLGGESPVRVQQSAALFLSVAFFTVFFLYRDGMYRGGGLLQIRTTENVLRASVQAMLIMFVFACLFGLQSATGTLLIAIALVPVLLIMGKYVFMLSTRHLRRQNNVVLYGVGDAVKRILSALSHIHDPSLNPVLIIDDDRPHAGESISQIRHWQDRLVQTRRGPISAALLHSCQCNTLVVALPNSTPDKVHAAIQAANQAGANVAFLYGTELGRQPFTKTVNLDGLSLVPLYKPGTNRCSAVVKRAFDLAGASLSLLLLSPLQILIVILVKLDSPGPAIFCQERVGYRGKHFKMYKFRSMHTNATVYDVSPVTSDDPRITRIGRLLRKTSLDELPQLVNVLLGHMSLVGPRPEMPFITHSYTAEQRLRLQVIPGITGLWQLSAARAFPIHENIQHDFYYIRNRTFFMDIAILIHTLFFALNNGI